MPRKIKSFKATLPGKSLYEFKRGSPEQRGYGYQWRKNRKWFLSANPICVACKESDGIIEPATVVDHVVPHKGDLDKFWDQSNWQALCKRCHDRKTATEGGAWDWRTLENG